MPTCVAAGAKPDSQGRLGTRRDYVLASPLARVLLQPELEVLQNVPLPTHMPLRVLLHVDRWSPLEVSSFGREFDPDFKA